MLAEVIRSSGFALYGGAMVSTWVDKLALRVEGQCLVANWNTSIANDYEGYAMAA